MWGTQAALGAASGACWWWQTVFADHLLNEYTAIATFVNGNSIPYTDVTWKTCDISGLPSLARGWVQTDTNR